MWIIPKNISDTYPSVVVTRESEVDSEEFSLMCEKSLMLKSKPSLSATWLRRWKRTKFIQHLCSRTLKDSHSESFVDALTSCLVDSPANLSQEQDSRKQQKIQDTCSPTSLKESKSVDPLSCSSKTSKGSSVARQPMENQFSTMSSDRWKKWVTSQRQEYSQRLKSERLIRESESSSWPTPAARDWKGYYNVESQKKRFRNLLPDAVEAQEMLSWPTARTSDAEGGRIETEITDKGFRSKRKKSDQWFGAKLRDAVETHENWPTPTVAEGGKIGNNPNYGQLGLSNHPEVHGQKVQREKLHKDRKGLSKAGLHDQAKTNKSGKSRELLWGTPKEVDSRAAHTDRGKSNLGEQVQHNTGKKLNANWVEQLMGLPVGWTQLPTEWID